MFIQNQQEEDQQDGRIANKLQVSRGYVKNKIVSLQLSKNGKLLISVSASEASINIISSATFKLLMKRNYLNAIDFISNSCLSPNFKLFVITISDGNLLVYQNFVNLVYHKKFEQQQQAKFITNEELLIWSSQYLIWFNVIKQQNFHIITLNNQFPIYFLDFNIEKQLIFIGSKNIKIRSLTNGLPLFESEQLQDDEIKYIKYQVNNQIITRHLFKVIIIWTINIDQQIIQQCQVINAPDNIEIIYTYMIRHDYIFTIQRRDRTYDLFAIIYTKTGSIINIRRQQLNLSGQLAILIAGEMLNSERYENTCLFLESFGYFIFQFLILDTIQKYTLKFKLPLD